jgi:DNA-binding LytR/AlgR family response regulator
MIDVLIIEDEITAARRIAKLLEETDPEINILENLQSIESAVSWFQKNNAPDLIILDIQLADGISFEIFKQVKVESFIIFTTAYDEYAIRAFELNSIDYLLKPVDRKKLEQSIIKFRKLNSGSTNFNVESLLQYLSLQKKEYKKRFMVNAGEKLKSIDTENIAFFYSSEKFTFLCSKDDRHYALENSLDKLENILDPGRFFRINRQYLVSLDSLDKIYILSKSRIKVELKPEVKDNIYVSKGKTHEFRVWLDK